MSSVLDDDGHDGLVDVLHTLNSINARLGGVLIIASHARHVSVRS